MLETDLTSISTQGWFTESSVENELLPISTLGWFYIAEIDEDVLPALPVFSVILSVNRLLALDLTR